MTVVLSMVLIWRNARPTPGLGLGERVGFAVADALARLKPARTERKSETAQPARARAS